MRLMPVHSRYEKAIPWKLCVSVAEHMHLTMGLHVFLDFGLTFFGGLNQKTATICMCKIHIYINSDSFRLLGKMGF